MQLKHGYLYQNKIKLLYVIAVDLLLAVLPIKKRKLPDNINKILIIKPDHLGDMLNLTAVLPLIKEKYPEAVIDMVGNSWNLAVIENNPHIRRKYVVNHYRANRHGESFLQKAIEYLCSIVRSAVEIRKEKYDLGIILRAYGNNLIGLARIGGCRYIIGHGTGGFGPWLDGVAKWGSGKHEIGHFLEVLSLVGVNADPGKLKPELYPGERDKSRVDEIWRRNYSAREKVAIVHPGSGNMRKSLTVGRWSFIIGLLEAKGYRVAITGSRNENILAQNIATKTTKIFCGQFNPMELALFFKKADFIVAVDSFAAHLAGYSDRKAVAFYSGIDDINQWRPVNENVRVFAHGCEQAPCFRGCDKMTCMDISFGKIENEIMDAIK